MVASTKMYSSFSKFFEVQKLFFKKVFAINISESEISSVGALDILDVLLCDCLDLFAGDLFKLTLDKLKAHLLSFGACIVNKVFGEGHKSVGMAAVKYLT